MVDITYAHEPNLVTFVIFTSIWVLLFVGLLMLLIFVEPYGNMLDRRQRYQAKQREEEANERMRMKRREGRGDAPPGE
mgnify:CR=1 FL=1